MKKLLTALVALSLTSCSTFPAVPGFDPGVPPVAGQLVNKAIPALVTAWRAYDAVLTAVNALRAAGVIRDGTPRALQIADILERMLNALNAATEAVRAGNETNFNEAMARAQQAFTDARAAIGGS